MFMHSLSLHSPTASLRTLFRILLIGCAELIATVAMGASCDAIQLSEYINASAPYPSCHASTLVELNDHTIAAAWFGGTHERNPDVGIWYARRIDGQWEDGVEVANGIVADGTRYPTWNPVLFQPPGADLHLFYKVGPHPSKWWGMLITSPDNGVTWSEPVRLPDGIIGPVKNKPVVLKDGSWLSPSSTEESGVGWRVHFEHTSDGGKTWQKTGPVDPGVGLEAIQPSILFHDGQTLQALCRTKQGSVGMTWSDDGGKTWSPIAATELPNPNSGTDAVTLKDGRQLIVYNHYGHWPHRSGKGYRYPLNIALSDDGITWRSAAVLETEPRDAGYAYPAVIQDSRGRVHISYTWDRKYIKYVVIDPSRL